MYKQFNVKEGYIYTDNKGHYFDSIATNNISKFTLIKIDNPDYQEYLLKQENRKKDEQL